MSQICSVTLRTEPVWGSVIETCLERKSAPIVALYWPVNFWEWYRFMREVLPTLVASCLLQFSMISVSVSNFCEIHECQMVVGW